MSQQLPVCSVCIANYNGIGMIDACIESVYAQDCDFPVEIIVHDDASTDGSAQYIRTNYPDVRLIDSAGNVGFCIANNRMAEAARGEYFLLLNNDATLLPDALRTLNLEAGQIDRPAILGLPQYDAASGKLIDIGSLFDPFLNPIPNLDPGRNDVGMIIGACLWIPKELWIELGGFPEWFNTLAEDMYLCCLARLRGYPVKALGSSGFRHRVGSSLGGGKITSGQRLSTSRHRRALSERNKSFVMVTTYPFPMLQLITPVHLALLLLEGVLLALIKLDLTLFLTIYLAALKGVWQKRSQLLQLRRGIQSARKVGVLQFASATLWIPWKLRLLIRHGFPEIR